MLLVEVQVHTWYFPRPAYQWPFFPPLFFTIIINYIIIIIGR